MHVWRMWFAAPWMGLWCHKPYVCAHLDAPKDTRKWTCKAILVFGTEVCILVGADARIYILMVYDRCWRGSDENKKQKPLRMLMFDGLEEEETIEGYKEGIHEFGSVLNRN